MAAKRGSGDSKALIVVLVFFILATIGLGVGTYYGYSGQEALISKEKEANNKAKTYESDMKWYRFQARAYRAMLGQMGTIDPGELLNDKNSFDNGSLKGPAKESEEVKAVFTELGKTLPWQAGKNIPEINFANKLDEVQKHADEVEKANNAKVKEVAALQKKNAELEELLASNKKEFEDQLAKAGKKATADLSDFVKTKDDLLATTTKLGEEKVNFVKRLEEEKVGSQKSKSALEKAIREQREVLTAKQEELNQAKKLSGGVEIPKDWSNDWRVTSTDRNGRNVFINLGSADHLVPQLTFSIHGTDPSGRPLAESKGSLEVVSVMSEHQSKAVLTGIKDANRDPILRGDVLYHPTWSPSLHKHVAVAGIIDLTGDGRDVTSSMTELLRNLDRQNVIVDAYLDLRDGTIHGRGMSPKTEYLILGEGTEVLERPDKEQKEFANKLARGMDELTEQAKKYGVQTIPLRRYLELIGYRIPRTLAERKAGTTYRINTGSSSSSAGDDSPAAPREKPQPKEDRPALDDKPKEEKPAPEKKPEPAKPAPAKPAAGNADKKPDVK